MMRNCSFAKSENSKDDDQVRFFAPLSCSKWMKYSKASSFELNVDCRGLFDVSVIHLCSDSDEVKENVIFQTGISNDNRNTASFLFVQIPDNGLLICRIRSLSQDAYMYSVFWSGAKSEDSDEVRIALCFTSFHREQYVEANLNRILGLDDDRIFTYIVDNGNSIDLPENDHYKVIGNLNTGGAGGFARGMMEISRDLKNMGFTHFVLMDDDIDLDPCVLERLITFLSYIKDEYKDSFIGGSMLRRDLEYFLVETGAKRYGLQIRGNGFGLDMRNLKDCLINDSFEDADYNAWWFCCIPVSYLRDDNYPLPLFFQWDDVDYGIRNKARVITMNGICVWHDCFDSKRSAQYIYYSTRNPLIVDACHEGRVSKKEYLKILRRSVIDQIYMYRYHEAEALLRGVEDFLKGPDWLCELDQDVYNKEILQLNAPMISCDVDMDRYRLCIGIEDCDKLHKLVREFTMNGMLLKADRKIIIPLYADRPVQTYRATEVLYYDEVSGRGYTAHKNFKKAIECYKKYLKIRRLVSRNYDRIGEEYRSKYPYMTSRALWEKILKINIPHEPRPC